MKKQIIVAVLTVMLASSACTKKTEESTTETTSNTTAQTTSNTSGTQTGDTGSASKVEIEDMTVGKGAEAVSGKTVTVNYVGTLKDKTKFDSSYDRKEPFSFSLGAGQVIKGWEQGIVGMKVGGKRKLTIPPELAYGDNAVGAIPAKSTLIFEVELLDVK